MVEKSEYEMSKEQVVERMRTWRNFVAEVNKEIRENNMDKKKEEWEPPFDTTTWPAMLMLWDLQGGDPPEDELETIKTYHKDGR